ncbi:glycosyltransferase family 2 protein [Bacillus carboniphilus]|uniref:Glycosyltransferase family 2 protein n=1 Tax=Bacillus carboniphilus TaxID=86663 RepID=A0ABY9JSK1_9BACI|nr:glycosyltransferase family 2 protein [Bacillus carboniphilus]WLR41473.1 glycosyltransferase family 2 protein [Bacillus carboniphilus]
MIRISLCMIVKNEEDTLDRCLSSVKGVPDEIIIVDTGSTDATKEIAKKHNARIYDFEWIDDFAAARNFSFSKARKDYIMWLDADDLLLPEDRQKLLNLKERISPKIDAISMIYHTLFDEHGNVVTSVRRIRIVKKIHDFKWHGFVHEDLTTEEPYKYFDSDIIVTHKKPEDKMNKAEEGKTGRNLQIYERHLKAGKELSKHDLFHYSRELHSNKRYDDAIVYYEQFLELEDIELQHRLFVMHKLASCYHIIGNIDKEREITFESLKWDVPHPSFSCRIAEWFLEKEHYAQAAYWYEQALNDKAEDTWLIDQLPFRTWLPHKQLGLCYFHLQKYHDSLFHNKKVLEYQPNDEATMKNIKMLEGLI